MKPTKSSYELLTFYRFVDIPENEVDSVAQEHQDFCSDLGLRGRIYIGTEGISSTVSGNLGQCRAYRLFLESSKYFRNIPDIDIKSTPVDGHQFEKMLVKVRNEIVVLGEKVTAADVQKYRQEVTPEEFKKIVDEGNDDYIILDMRNDYEYQLGHFKGAIPAGTVNFREVPELLRRYKEQANGKKIIWYCTGGIRCEKAAVLANKSGLPDVYAIEGGIVKYTNMYNDGNWLGNLYTFDGRVSTQIGDENTHTTIGICVHTGKLTDHCDNCRYTECNARLIVDFDEHKKHAGFCSEECYQKASQNLLIKDVDWDDFSLKSIDIKIQNPQTPYKELRSWVRNGKISLLDAQELVARHLGHLLGKTTFPHRESQKEGVIVMD